MWLDKFNDIRKKSGMSLDELSEKSGVPKGTLAKITSGITKAPSLETMRTLVHTMGCTLDDIDDTYIPDRLTPQEKEIALAYRKANADDRAVVEITLRKYIETGQEKTVSAG